MNLTFLEWCALLGLIVLLAVLNTATRSGDVTGIINQTIIMN